MDQRKSSLNPYAASYIPLSQRGQGNESRTQMNHGEAVGEYRNASPKHPEIQKRLALQNPDEETEMDLAYLASLFPGMSNESLADVYYQNRCQVEASIDMLRDLEGPADFSPRLPETLDIGDVPEFGCMAEGSTAKLKVSTGETSGSSKYVQ